MKCVKIFAESRHDDRRFKHENDDAVMVQFIAGFESGNQSDYIKLYHT